MRTLPRTVPVPKTCPQFGPASGARRAMPATALIKPFRLVASGVGAVAPLLYREVLRRTGQHADLQAL